MQQYTHGYSHKWWPCFACPFESRHAISTWPLRWKQNCWAKIVRVNVHVSIHFSEVNLFLRAVVLGTCLEMFDLDAWIRWLFGSNVQQMFETGLVFIVWGLWRRKINVCLTMLSVSQRRYDKLHELIRVLLQRKRVFCLFAIKIIRRRPKLKQTNTMTWDICSEKGTRGPQRKTGQADKVQIVPLWMLISTIESLSHWGLILRVAAMRRRSKWLSDFSFAWGHLGTVFPVDLHPLFPITDTFAGSFILLLVVLHEQSPQKTHEMYPTLKPCQDPFFFIQNITGQSVLIKPAISFSWYLISGLLHWDQNYNGHNVP